MPTFLEGAKRQFRYYKKLGDLTFEQISDEDFFYSPDPEANSIAVIIEHLHGNMQSRWTDLLTTDGEKSWRNRDQEFLPHQYNRQELLKRWDTGWNVLFNALENLTEDDLQKTIYIRDEPHSVTEAILRQLCHYPYHVGQIVHIGKSRVGAAWQSLSIPRGKSASYIPAAVKK